MSPTANLDNASDTSGNSISSRLNQVRSPLAVTMGAGLLFFFRFGYDYGRSDQDEIIPFLLHRLNPELFAQDWFVQTQSSAFGVRTYFVAVLEGISQVSPVWLSILLVYIASWLLVGSAVYLLCRHFTRSDIAAACCVVGVLVLSPQWTLGGNDLIHSMLTPSMFGWGFGLWGVLFVFRDRLLLAGLMMGLATWMQALVGLQLALLSGFLLLVDLIKDETHLKAVLIFACSYIIFALPALVPLLLQQAATPAMAEGNAPSLFYIMAQFRNPHHYLFFSFSPRSFVRFGVVAALGTMSLVYLIRGNSNAEYSKLGRLLLIILFLCLVGFTFTEIVPVLLVAKLQLFKTTVLAKIVFFIAITGAGIAILPKTWRHLLEGQFKFIGPISVLLCACWFIVGWQVATERPIASKRIGPYARAASPIASVEQWAQNHTAPSAVFAVPPSWSGFRSSAQRAIAIDFKAFPYRDDDIISWYRRISDWAPQEEQGRSSPSIQSNLDEAYYTLSPDELYRLSQEYTVDYVVANRALAADSALFELVYVDTPWHVYKWIEELQPSE